MPHSYLSGPAAAPAFLPHWFNVRYQALRWVLRLRWALVALVLGLMVLATILKIELPVLPMSLVLLAWTFVNVGAVYALAVKNLPSFEPSLNAWVAGHIALDIVALSALLYFSGGATNPFVSFYLPLLGLAAVFLPWQHGVFLAGLSVLAYTGLMRWYQDLVLPNIEHAMHLHVQGMWLNFVLSTVVLMGLVLRLSYALRRRDEDLMWAQLRLAADERLAALGNGFAATAHQLGTPLSVLAMMFADWKSCQDKGLAVALQKDELDSLLHQTQTMQQVLQDLRARVQPQRELPLAGGPNAHGADTAHANLDSNTNLYAWLESACADWRNTNPAQALQLKPFGLPEQPWVALPCHVFSIALKVVLDNAIQAHRRCALVPTVAKVPSIELSVQASATHWVLVVKDQGGGVDERLRLRLGYELVESSTSQGMGLYLLNVLLLRLGGFLRIQNTEGGAQVEVHFPKAGI